MTALGYITALALGAAILAVAELGLALWFVWLRWR